MTPTEREKQTEAPGERPGKAELDETNRGRAVEVHEHRLAVALGQGLLHRAPDCRESAGHSRRGREVLEAVDGGAVVAQARDQKLLGVGVVGRAPAKLLDG